MNIKLLTAFRESLKGVLKAVDELIADMSDDCTRGNVAYCGRSASLAHKDARI